MPVALEPNNISDVLFWEIDPTYSREVVTIAAGRWLPIGSVLGRVTASGLYVAFDPAATDGSQNPAAVLLADTDAFVDVKVAAFVRGGIVKRSGLKFINSVTPEQQAAALAALSLSGIVARDTA
jgi:hypothetical protein